MGKWEEELYEKSFRVAVFGSARIKRGDQRYKMIYTLAKMIARENIDIVTGGGPGIMEAANKGHKEVKGKAKGVHSIGLNIKLPKEQKANRHLDIEKDFKKFSDRLDNFMYLSNVVVVAPGGVGTMLEFLYTWQLVQVEHICDTPIILMGDMWADFIKWIKKWPLKNNFIAEKDMNNIFFAKNCREAIKIIKAANEAYSKRVAHVCTNIRKYHEIK